MISRISLFLVIFFTVIGYSRGSGGESVVSLVSIDVTPKNPTLHVGETEQFKAIGIFSDGSTRVLTIHHVAKDGMTVTWSSSNTAVATINVKRLVTGLTSGTTTVTATSGGISGSITLTVVNPTFTLSVSKPGRGGGMVISRPDGIDCGASCSASFDSGAVVSLTARPAAGFIFSGWGKACKGIEACSITMTANQSVTATFTPTFTLSVSKPGRGGGMVISRPGGIDCGASCSASFDSGAVVSLTASPAAGFIFSGWGGACTGLKTCSVTMKADQLVTATFAIPTFTFSVSKPGRGGGMVISRPGGIDCGASCSASFDSGAVVSLTASPVAGFIFSGWGGACTGIEICNVTMTANQSVTATFVPAFALSVTVSGSGMVSSQPVGIECGAICSASFDSGAVVSLTASPVAEFIFSGWGGACTGIGACSVTMTANQSITATFVTTVALNVTVSGSGMVSSQPAGIECGAICTASFVSDMDVDLTATPAAGFIFSGWGKACTGIEICSVTMTANQSVTATFVPAFALSVTVSGSGTVSSHPAGIECGATCTASFVNGMDVDLTASPSAGFIFSGWGGACTGLKTCSITMKADQLVTATFAIPTFTFSVSKPDRGGGMVISHPDGIDCGASCSASFDSGVVVSLTASPAAGFIFSGWGGACTGIEICSVTMTANQSITATFVTTVALNVTVSGGGTVSSQPAGIECGASCKTSFTSGTVVDLTANPAAGFVFSGWGRACSGLKTCSVTMKADQLVTATFAIQTFIASVAVSGSGTVSSRPAGIECGATCTASFASGTGVSLTASPSAGFIFSGWGGVCTGIEICSVTMTANQSITATFVTTVALNVTVSGGGTVSSRPAGIECGATCKTSFTSGTVVDLTASPAAGFIFSGWGKACKGMGACSVTMTANQSVTAAFVPTFALNVTVVGGGTVSSRPAGIECGATCTASFTNGTNVGLMASPAAGFVFSGWGRACSGLKTCSVTMKADQLVTATFAIQTFIASVAVSGSGMVSSRPAGIECGATCTASFVNGMDVDLTASPSAGFIFSGWGKACKGMGACSVTMTANQSVAATFTVQTFALSVTVLGSGTASSRPTGIECGATCTASFTNGTSVGLTASPTAGFVFSGWGKACTGIEICSVTMTANQSVTATFVPTFALSVTVSGGGTVSSQPAGIECGATCSTSFANGTGVDLTASPAAGFIFSGWGKACKGMGACSVTMTANQSVTAIFVPTFALSVTVLGSGTASSRPAGIECGATCKTSFTSGTVVDLTASPAAGFIFSGWGKACKGMGACSVTMTANQSVTAAFVPTFALNVTVVGGGTVSSRPTGIECGATCTASFTNGMAVSLTASPAAGFVFSGWAEACSGLKTCSVTMKADQLVTATFTIQTFIASVAVSGSGMVSSQPAGIECGASCSASFVNGMDVDLTASPSAGFIFSGWGKACKGMGACSVTMTANQSVAATFTVQTFALSVTVLGSGTVSSHPAGIECGATCSVSFVSGTVVSLIAGPAAGFTFSGWGGACTGLKTCSVTMAADRPVTATFVPTFALSVTVSGGGTVSSHPAGIECGATCSTSFANGTGVDLTASPAAGFTFSGWDGACSGTGACSVTMTTGRSVTATFGLIPPAIPIGLTATPSNGQVRLTWNASTGATSYTLYMATTSWTTWAATLPDAMVHPDLTSTTFTHRGLTNGMPYWFAVSALNSGGESAPSAKASATPIPPTWAYVVGKDSGTVSVMDTSNNTMMATVPVGVGPREVAVHAAANRAYVANQFSSAVSVIDTITNTVVATVPVETSPYGVAVHAAANRAYVTNQFSSAVSVIDTITNTVIAKVPVGTYPYGVAVHAAANRVYVTNQFSNTVSVIDTTNNTVVDTVSVGNGPVAVAVNAAANRVYVTNQFSNTVSVIDTISHAVVGTVSVGISPRGVAVHMAAQRAYVTNTFSNTVSVIDTVTNTVVATVPVGTFPNGVAVHAAANRAYVANQGSSMISVIDTSNNRVVDTVVMGGGPVGVAIVPTTEK